MRIIIAGSRDIYSQEAWEILNQNPPPILVKCSEIVSGGARGVDTFAEELADKYEYPFRLFPADWETHGRAAGPLRNTQMAQYADALIAIWDGSSRGTQHMIGEMRRLGKPVYVLTRGNEELETKSVYILEYMEDFIYGENEFLGVYSSREKVEEAMKYYSSSSLRKLDDFSITEVFIDENYGRKL